MFLEAFHRLLKVVYLHHKQNRRFDYLMNILLKVNRDKIFEHLTKIEKGKYYHRVVEINKRHKAAVSMRSSGGAVIQRDETNWEVPSEKDGSMNYTVQLVNKSCKCQLRCTNCKACIHMYTCLCMDAILHCTVCKHNYSLSSNGHNFYIPREYSNAY